MPFSTYRATNEIFYQYECVCVLLHAVHSAIDTHRPTKTWDSWEENANNNNNVTNDLTLVFQCISVFAYLAQMRSHAAYIGENVQQYKECATVSYENSPKHYGYGHFFRTHFFTLFLFRIFNTVRRRHCRTKETNEYMSERENQWKSKHCSYLFFVLCAGKSGLYCSILHTKWVFVHSSFHYLFSPFSWIGTMQCCLEWFNIHWIVVVTKEEKQTNN